jgi:hypothetical protein
MGKLHYPFSQAEEAGTPTVLDGGSPFTLSQEDWWLSFGDFGTPTVPNGTTLDAPEVITDGNGNEIAPVLELMKFIQVTTAMMIL